MTNKDNQIADVKKLSNKELLELLRHYNLYATSNGGNKNALVIPGPDMLKEIRRRLLGDETPIPNWQLECPEDETPNKLDVI